MKPLHFLQILAIILINQACALYPPDIHFTGNQTVIERQIVGNYEELEKDAWIIASVQTSTQKTSTSQAISGGDPQLFRALKIREYHLEKIRSYKNESAIGETFTGYIKYIQINKYQTDKVARDILLRTIDTENTARKTIFVRTLFRVNKKEPQPAEITMFGRMFAKEQHKLAQKNDWIEETPEKWLRKK